MLSLCLRAAGPGNSEGLVSGALVFSARRAFPDTLTGPQQQSLEPRRGRNVSRLKIGANLDEIDIPKLDPILPRRTVVSLRHISHILPTVYKPPQHRGVVSMSQGSIFFATGNKNKIREACPLSESVPHFGPGTHD